MPNLKSHTGRPFSTRLAEDLATLFLFSRKDSSINTSELGQLLGTPKERTEEIFTMLSTTSSSAPDDQAAPLVPLLEKDEAGTRTRVGIEPTESKWAVRLTEIQAEALGRALDQTGFTPVDPLRSRVMAAFAPDGYVDEVREREIEPWCTGALLMCARSLAQATRVEDGSFEQPALRFAYRDEKQPSAMLRHAIPRRLRVEAGQWMLDAYQLSPSEGMRIFLVADMNNITLDEKPSLAPASSPQAKQARMVRLSCPRELEAEVLRWDGARKVAGEREPDGRRRGTSEVSYIEVPYYNGERIPRLILSMNGAVTCEDEDINEYVADLAQADLELAAELAKQYA